MPTEAGEITILPQHAPLVGIVKVGEIRIKKTDVQEVVSLSISGGIIEIRPSDETNKTETEVVILAFQTELATEIDIMRAEEAYARALKAMEDSENLVDTDFAKFQAVLDKELNRINLAKKWRK